MNDSVGNSPVNKALAWVNGSDAPEKSSLDLGFMALTDCASLVVAAAGLRPALRADAEPQTPIVLGQPA